MSICADCKNRKEIPSDSHISCSNPPREQYQIGSGGDERYTKAQAIAKNMHGIVRCIWPGSGWFPICFDENTVFGCDNYEGVKANG